MIRADSVIQELYNRGVSLDEAGDMVEETRHAGDLYVKLLGHEYYLAHDDETDLFYFGPSVAELFARL